MAIVTAGAGYALDMYTLDLSARINFDDIASGYYNEVDNHWSGEAIRFWHNDKVVEKVVIDGKEIDPDYLQNFTRLTGDGLYTTKETTTGGATKITGLFGTVNRINVVSNEADELTISRFSMSLENLYGYVNGEGTQAFLATALNGNDQITGSAEVNVLGGFAGNDVLTGGAGGDTFVFDTTLDRLSNVDKITDFSSDDTIQLDDAIFNVGGLAGTTLTAGALANWDSPDQLDDRIIYRHIDSADADTLKDTVQLYYDATGGKTGDAVLFATLTNQASVTLTADDFRIG